MSASKVMLGVLIGVSIHKAVITADVYLGINFNLMDIVV